ncbi:ExbD/TolR family protein [Uliginosibacterium paludis]|uniref:Biopolymer transporter ExbD n=1 Tax=Uliginosibacterium paludis TaxID=1615952 RepID=A0ABV2CTA3_9RHOO
MAFSNADDDVVSDINVTPLVDVMLVLLVAFIVTIPALTQSISVNLPATQAASSPQPQKPVTVSIDAVGGFHVGEHQVPDLDAVVSELSLARNAQGDGLSIQIQADVKAAYEPVAKLLGALEHAGFSKLSLLTAPE